MLLLQMKRNQKIHIGKDVVIFPLKNNRIGIEAPLDIEIYRETIEESL